MPIIAKRGNLLNTSMQTICCTVNTVGAMGAGIALAIKNKFPEVFEIYMMLCRTKQLKIDTLWTVDTNDGRQVLLFPTKEHWRNPSKEEWVIYNLERLATDYPMLQIESLAMVLPGARNGKLDKDWVTETVYSTLSDMPIQVELYT